MDATTDDPQSATVYGDIHEAGLAIDFEQMLDTAADHLPVRLQVEFGLDACDDPTAIEKVVTKQRRTCFATGMAWTMNSRPSISHLHLHSQQPTFLQAPLHPTPQ